MNKIYPFILSLVIAVGGRAQDQYKEPSAESRAYHAFVEKITIPPYSLQKIQALIKHIKPVDHDDDSWESAISPKVYASLTLREKFTYNMINAESYSQNCDVELPVQDEQQKVFGHLRSVFGEGFWSQRQLQFFKDNKDSVIGLMAESIQRSKHIGLNYKEAIVEINAVEMIPLLISTYNEKRNDHDILTVLMLLMKANKYPPFLQSTSYEKLYANAKGYRAFLNFNQANEQLIIQRASAFFEGSFQYKK